VRDIKVPYHVADYLPELDASAGAELLVVGSSGHCGSSRPGSVGQHCVHHATCPVVVIRDPVTGAG